MRITSCLFFACLTMHVACGDDNDTPEDDTTGSGTADTSSASTADAASSSDASSSSTGAPGECQVLSITESAMLFGGAGESGIAMRVDPPLAGYAKTRLVFELYREGEDQISPGTFDLTAPPDDDYGVCTHCNLLVGYDATDRARIAFFQSRGDLVLDYYDRVTYEMAGHVEGLRLVEVTQSPATFEWRVVDNGRCFDVPRFDFDTRIVDGGPCERAEDCPNEAEQICDPVSKTCAPAQCDLAFDFKFCDSGYMCLSQFGTVFPDEQKGGPAAGACYAECVPGAGGCAAGETCVPIGPVQDVGICLATGTTPVGETCGLSDVSTDCAPGAMCDEPGICRALCDYLEPQGGCSAETYCTDQNLCRPLDAGDVTMIGGICSSESRFLTNCGPEGDAFRGLCIDIFPGEPLECLRLCRTVDGDCPGTETCLGLFQNPLIGICHAPPTCGDGELDLVGGEVCDDHNVIDGDGCSADCRTVDLAPLCAQAEPFVTGELSVGSNVDGVTGYVSGCSLYQYAPSKTYSYTPPAPGKLMLRLDSPHVLTLSVLANCADPATELNCSFDPYASGSQTVTANFPTADPGLIVVTGDTPLQVGTFFLHGTFVPAVCGDGDVSGGEVCDDGNLVDGDGCAADCSEIFWDQLCSALPLLDLAQPTIGNLDDGGTQYFDVNGCSASGTVEDAYRFTAPSDGTLTLTLAADEDLVLYVNKGCEAVTFEGYVACINWPVLFPGEPRTTMIPLSAGQPVTVMVEGYTDGQAGAYTLTASFAP